MGNMSIRGALAAASAAAIVLVSPAQAFDLKGFVGQVAKDVGQGLGAAGNAANAGIDGINQAHAANNSRTVAGTVPTADGQVVTYFNGMEVNGVTAGYLNRTAVATPGGRIPLAGYWAKKPGSAPVFVANDLNAVRAAGVLVLPNTSEQQLADANSRHKNVTDESGCNDKNGSMRGRGQATAGAVKDVGCELGDKSTPTGGLMSELFDKKRDAALAAEARSGANRPSVGVKPRGAGGGSSFIPNLR